MREASEQGSERGDQVTAARVARENQGKETPTLGPINVPNTSYLHHSPNQGVCTPH